MTHHIKDVNVTRQDLLDLRLVDYPGLQLQDLVYEDLQSGKSQDYKDSLALSVREKGVLIPILLLKREPQRAMLVDGHHRATISLAEGYNIPAELHLCSCPSDTWDTFDLCPTIWAAHEDRKHDDTVHA